MENLFNLEAVVNACFMDKNYKNSQLIHKHRQSHGFVYYKSGNSIYNFKGGKSVKAESGRFLYLPKYSSYTVSVNDYGEIYCINLLCNDDVFNIKNSNPNMRSFSFELSRVLEVESLYKKVVREMFFKRPYYELTVKSLVYNLAAIIYSEKYSAYVPTQTSEKLQPAITYINEHYIERDLNIPNLARMCNLSESYFRRLFIKCYNKSPIKYINERRINYATEFLQSGLYSISEVAVFSGFEDLGYFSRVYKRITGEMPSEILKKIACSKK